MGKRKIRYYSPKRRAIYARGDKVDSLALFEAHDWTCVICLQKIDRYRRVPDWGAATVEHIVPLAQGGQHVWENVAPAHLKCNLDKGSGSLQDWINQQTRRHPGTRGTIDTPEPHQPESNETLGTNSI